MKWIDPNEGCVFVHEELGGSAPICSWLSVRKRLSSDQWDEGHSYQLARRNSRNSFLSITIHFKCNSNRIDCHRLSRDIRWQWNGLETWFPVFLVNKKIIGIAIFVRVIWNWKRRRCTWPSNSSTPSFISTTSASLNYSCAVCQCSGLLPSWRADKSR